MPACSTGAWRCPREEPTIAERPNIVLITSDQHRGDCFGFEGRSVKTPHLDALALEGTHFSRCITPNAVCQPARASLLTGLLPRTHGVSDNGIDLDPRMADDGFAAAFAHAGYRTGFVGKAHFSTHHTFAPTGSPECRSTIPTLPADWHGPYAGFDHVETMVLGHYARTTPKPPPDALHYERWLYADGHGEDKVAHWQTRLPPDVEAPHTWNSGLPCPWHTSTWVGDRSVAYVEAHADEPFVLWASFPDPHTPFDCPEPWSRLHDPDEVEVPVHPERDFDRRPWWHARSQQGVPELADETLRRHRAEYSRVRPPDETRIRHLVANYYGMIALIDHNVGRILSALSARGLAENTLVVFTADHGEWLGDHGLLLKGPMLYEGLLRVGCIARGPGVAAGAVIDEPISTLDLVPTFYDVAGVAVPRALHGRNLARLLRGEPETRDFAFSEWDLRPSRCGDPLELRTVRTASAKLTLEALSGAGELYCLAEDPHEMENRFDDPGCAALRRELLDMIRSRPDDAIPPLTPVGMA